MPSGRPVGTPGAPAGAPSVVERLRRRLATQGRLPFAVVMEEALYGDGGYYRRAVAPIGRQGDFITGSSYSPLFGRATATLLRRLDAVLDGPAELFEAGCGEGSHLAAVAEALGAPPGRAGGGSGGGTPGRESGLEPGRVGERAAERSEPAARRRLRGWDRVARPLPPGVDRLERLEEVAPREVHGLLFSYELFDALPVHRLVGLAGGEVGELWVETAADGALALRPGALSDPGLAGLLAGAELAEGQVADLAPGWRPLYGRLAERLGRGLLVTCDYGFERRRLLDRRVRLHGTLAGYRRHTVHRDALRDLGRQDLTAHVDFTALRETGEAAGLATVAFTRQARWLAACGLFDDLAGADPATRVEARQLLDGEGMGEEIRVLVQGRGIAVAEVLDLPLLGAT